MTSSAPRFLPGALPVAMLIAVMSVVACGTLAISSSSPPASSTGEPTPGPRSAAPAASAAPQATEAQTGSSAIHPSSSELFDASRAHDISISFDDAAYQAMIDIYASSGDKDWIEATITIDGAVYERAGIRLKGNSSLAALREETRGPRQGGVSAENPESLPWLVDLDRFVEGQNHGGVAEFVVRSNPSKTGLNEAVALELLERAGLASQEAVAVRFVVNGGEQVLRLVIEHPDDRWMAETFSEEGALYKAESSGDYSYRGDDPEAYDEVFDQEAGDDNADLTPLIEFLDFINNSDDATFAAKIRERLAVDAFASYLAMQELLGNFDDIDGPGNNSYLYYDSATGRFTVVPWDYNLAFGGLEFHGGPGGIDGPIFPLPSGMELPDAMDFPSDVDPAPSGGPPSGLEPGIVPGPGFRPDGERSPRPSNVLAERFLEIEEYQALVDQRTAELRTELFESGIAEEVVGEWVELLKTDASDLVDAATVDREAEQITSEL